MAATDYDSMLCYSPQTINEFSLDLYRKKQEVVQLQLKFRNINLYDFKLHRTVDVNFDHLFSFRAFCYLSIIVFGSLTLKNTTFSKFFTVFSRENTKMSQISFLNCCEECVFAGHNVFLGPTIHLLCLECCFNSHNSHLIYVKHNSFQMRFQRGQ